MHVSAVGSAASDWAGSGRRSRLKRATSSSAKGIESAALPPFPNVTIRFSSRYAATITFATSSTDGSSAGSSPATFRCSASPSADPSGIHRVRGPLDRDRGGADDTDAVTECRGDDLDALTRRAHCKRVNALAHRREQLLAGPADAAPDDHHLGLEQIDDRRQA